MKTQGIKLSRQEHPNFACITDGPFQIDEASLPNGRLNFLDLETAIEIYTPLYQLFLTDSDFWRACNSLQLDETVALYSSKLLGDASYVGLVNNKHPLIPLDSPGRIPASPARISRRMSARHVGSDQAPGTATSAGDQLNQETC